MVYILEESVNKRSKKKKSNTINIDNLKKAVDDIYKQVPFKMKNALYIGVGHGHDSILALLEERVERIVGVDPYIDSHGNDDEDYEELLSLINDYGFNDRFLLYRTTIEKFLKVHDKSQFDLIIASDVLHHIYCTSTPLTKSEYYLEAVQLFSNLIRVSKPGCYFVVSEIRKTGIVPLFKKYGVLKKGAANHDTKQNMTEWNKAIILANWKLESVSYHVPYQLRKLKKVVDNKVFGSMICGRYYLYYRKTFDEITSKNI